jgi:uncharacterized protein
MMCRRSVVKTLAILLGAACLASPALAGVNAITWRDLRPAAQPGSLSQLLADTKSASETEVLAWRDDQEVVQLTGFLLPVEQDGDFVTEFMLVPWAGACSHMPAPPPNQLVHVFPATPFRLDRIYQPVTVTAALRRTEGAGLRLQHAPCRRGAGDEDHRPGRPRAAAGKLSVEAVEEE